MTAPLPRLPKLLGIALRAGGMDVVIKLTQVFGGHNLNLSRRCSDNHPLVLAVGRRVADAICDEAGGGSIDFPKGSRTFQRLLLDEMLDRDPQPGENEIADTLGVTRRHVARLKAARLAAGAAPAQVAPPRRRVDPRQIDIEDVLNRKS